ncbi:hypothetical protein PMAYCL1PPCAC_15097, partial [Pristionchus mayeri]
GNVSINLCSSSVYFLMWRGLKSHSDSAEMKRIIRSLFIIVIVDVSGWLLTPGIAEIAKHLDLQPQQEITMVFFCGIFLNLAFASKLPIYYFTSSEYRAAMRSIILGKSADGNKMISITAK